MTVHDVTLQLPEPAALHAHCRALAVLESVLGPEWTDRHHFFAARWSETEALASMRDGSGDEYSIVFSPAGTYIRGFAHESPMSPYADDGPWPGVLDDVPGAFRPYIAEPAFSDEDGMPVVTACIWRTSEDDRWRTGTIDFPEETPGDPDGAAHLFHLLTNRSAEAFKQWAEDYYEITVDLAAVRHVLSSRPLTEELVRTLNPDITLDDLSDGIAETGYPVMSAGSSHMP